MNNSLFGSMKFNLNFFNIKSYYQKADLNVLYQSLLSFKIFLTKFSKQTLAVTLLFQCNPSSRGGQFNMTILFFL